MSRRRRLLFGLVAVIALVVAFPTTSSASPGTWTATDVNNAVAKGVAYLDAHQNADGSFGATYPEAETAFALMSYGVLDKGDYTTLPSAMQTHVVNAVTWLLGQQAADGSFGTTSGIGTYTTGLALAALSVSSGTNPGVATAIANARAWLIGAQQAPPSVTGNPASPDCSSADQPPAFSGTDLWCGGWNYDSDPGRSDESNTGFAMTGLAVTGGVPAAAAAVNIDWQRHVQELLATNYYAARNDGGGDYTPGENSGGFSSNANDTGSLLFGYGYDGVAGSDVKVQAAIKFAQDVLDTYELNIATTREMIDHNGMNEDGSCVIGAAGCDWEVSGDGGYHYSLWTLTKGLGEYIPPDLSNASNWYAKVADLLLTQQGSDGSWPVDGRDDATDIVATSFAINALGLVGVPTHTLTVTNNGGGTVTSSPQGIDCGSTCTASFSQGTVVQLTATPDANSDFTGWSGDCTGTGQCQVTMDQAHAVTANFSPKATTTTTGATTTTSSTTTSSTTTTSTTPTTSTTTTTVPPATTTTVPNECKPGHGYGDKNHCHSGPPGHGCMSDSHGDFEWRSHWWNHGSDNDCPSGPVHVCVVFWHFEWGSLWGFGHWVRDCAVSERPQSQHSDPQSFWIMSRFIDVRSSGPGRLGVLGLGGACAALALGLPVPRRRRR